MRKSKKQKVFFSGIGGSGVSAIANFMAENGNVVSGSDRAFDANPSHPYCIPLRNKGVRIFPQDGSGIQEAPDFAVFSTAVEQTNPDYAMASALGIEIKSRPACLAEIVSRYKSIAVSGTSGKTTASSMLAYIMRCLDLSPNFIGGGRVKQFLSDTSTGNSMAGKSDYLVYEACESDGTIVDYRPAHTIILNLSLDHHRVDETAGMFRTLSENTSGMVVANADDQNLHIHNLISDKTITFSIDEPSDYMAVDIIMNPTGQEFTLNGERFRLNMPGRHNLQNALSCIAVLCELGLKEQEIALCLPGFKGVERRFDIILNNGRSMVIDDYAHNPDKISALMKTTSSMMDSVCYIFQPHGYSPTMLMMEGYADAFASSLREEDRLILLPIYYAGGTAKKTVSSEDLAQRIRGMGASVRTVSGRDEILSSMDSDNYVVMGARDETLSGFARQIAKLLEQGKR